jgi:hypothetical protein
MADMSRSQKARMEPWKAKVALFNAIHGPVYLRASGLHVPARPAHSSDIRRTSRRHAIESCLVAVPALVQGGNNQWAVLDAGQCGCNTDVRYSHEEFITHFMSCMGIQQKYILNFNKFNEKQLHEDEYIEDWRR